jgi:hypothetical protein
VGLGGDPRQEGGKNATISIQEERPWESKFLPIFSALSGYREFSAESTDLPLESGIETPTVRLLIVRRKLKLEV